MLIFLLKDVHGLGMAGAVKNVAEGYARNYLLPQKMAEPVSAGQAEQLKTRQKIKVQKQQVVQQAAKSAIRRLDGKTIKVCGQTSAKGTLYRGISVGQIVQAVAEQLQQTIEPAEVLIKKPLKEVGRHAVNLRFHGETACLNVEILPDSG